jgi:predicted DNA-binding transcriptional regulator AlpA
VSKENPRNLPPQFLLDALGAVGYRTLPALAEELQVSRSWLYKMVKTKKLRGRVEDKPKVLMTGTESGSCYWLLADEVQKLAKERLNP